MQLTNKVKTLRLDDPTVAGASDITDTLVVDMLGFEGCRFMVGFGAITSGAATSIKVQQATAKSTDTALTSGADLEGSSVVVADTDDSKMVIQDIFKPRERYLQVHILRATQNSVVEFVIAEQYNTRKLPVTKDSSVATQELKVSPAEGTA